MIIGFFVYLWFVLESISAVVSFLFFAWCALFVFVNIFYRLGNIYRYQDVLDNRKALEKKYQDINGYYLASEIFFFIHLFSTLYKLLTHKIVKSIAILGFIIVFLLPTPKQMVIIASSPYIVEYFSDVKEDFTKNGTDKKIVEIPRNIVESIGNIDVYLEKVFNSDLAKQAVTTVKETARDFSNPEVKKEISQEELIRQITSQVTEQVIEGLK